MNLLADDTKLLKELCESMVCVGGRTRESIGIIQHAGSHSRHTEW